MLSIVLGLFLLTWLIPGWVEPDPDLRLPVSLVPQIVAIGFVLCGAALLFIHFMTARHSAENNSTAVQQEVPADTGFGAGEFRGLVLMILLLIIATMAFQLLHFMIVAPIMVALSMWMFGPVRLLSVLLTATIGPASVWILATQVLGRVLP